MKKQNLSKTKTHKLTRSGNSSYYVTLPIQFVRQLEWRERQKLNITLKGSKLVIEDWKK